MVVALIVAAGRGDRMGQDIPKQFLNVYDKPVLIYTLESFQRHPEIDEIAVVCLDGWQDVLSAYARQFDIKKLKRIFPGGATAQESIRSGVSGLKEICSDDDIVVIHDGIRPMIEDFVLTDVILKCRRYGNAVTSMPYNEQIFVAGDGETSDRYIPRDTLRRVSTPQAYRYGKLSWAYEKAFAENIGIQASTYANTLMVDLGERLHFAAGSEKNIKLTTKDDLELFKAYLKMDRDAWIK